MSQPFKNVILLVVFNYANCTDNKDFLTSLYKKYFKHIVFYSDGPESDDTEIHFVDTNRGYNTHAIFKHFSIQYKQMIEECDGIFYTMDDNILNVNILNLYSNTKLLYFHHELTKYEDHKEEQWRTPYGRAAVERLICDETWKRFNIDMFSGGDGYVGFSDFFYIPKQYISNTLFDMFELFAKHRVFLEIAIPTILNNLEKDPSKYQTFSSINAWPNRDFFLSETNIYNSIKTMNLCLHPIKCNQNPNAKQWLHDIFSKDRCVILTTINPPTETVRKHIQNSKYDVIIVGDKKTPDDYKDLRCIYLDIPIQTRLFPNLSEKIPYNHYCRKNIGYLYAITKGYSIVYETDDDNIPYDTFDNVLDCTNLQIIREANNVWMNIFKYFTYYNYIWPRGYPLSRIKALPNFFIESTQIQPSIINGLVENDPDVDALFRIICNHEASIQWEKEKKVVISNTNMCVFNTQNTFWTNPSLFISMLIPSSVSFRYCDILRGIVANVVLRRTNNCMMYTSPNVVQNRNEHNLISDFKSEYEMYLHNETIANYIYRPNVIYLIQAAGKLPDLFHCLRTKPHILLSYKEQTEDTTIFFPHSTWTTGRNKLREYALALKEHYHYYICLDEDVQFTDSTQEEGFGKMEELLAIYKPYIANPHLCEYYEQYTYLDNPPIGEVQTTIWFDGMCNAFSRDAFTSDLLFPYVDYFDKESWWMSQYILIILCSVYKKDVAILNAVHVINAQHSAYPCQDIFAKAEQYVFQELLKSTNIHWDRKDFHAIVPCTNPRAILSEIYDVLLLNKVIQQFDIDILRAWLEYF